MQKIEDFMSNPKVLYETSDAVENVVLLYFGIEPMDIMPHYQDNRRKVFRFVRTKELDAILERLAHGRLLVEPGKLLNANKSFKDLIRRNDRISQALLDS